MTDLHTKIERAWTRAATERPYDSGSLQASMNFLRALEAEGLKVLDGEVTEEMIDAGVENNRTSWNEGVDWEFPREVGMEIFIGMLAAAPTLADRLKEEK